MGNVLKAAATGGLSLLPGRAGDIAGSVATGVPFGWGGRSRGGPPMGKPGMPMGPTGGPAGLGGIEEGPQGPQGLVSKLIGGMNQMPQAEAAPVESPRQRAARQAAQKASRGRALPVQPQPVQPVGRVLPRQNPGQRMPTGTVNPAEVTGREMVTNKLGMY